MRPLGVPAQVLKDQAFPPADNAPARLIKRHALDLALEGRPEAAAEGNGPFTRAAGVAPYDGPFRRTNVCSFATAEP